MSPPTTDAPRPPQRVTDALQELGISHEIVVTKPATSAEESAEFQGLPVRNLLKTLVERRGEGDFVFVLVPGDRQIDWKKLRKHLGVSRLSLPDRDEAKRVTGYAPGTITPFGSATKLPVIVDESAKDAGVVTLGAGERGVNVHVQVGDLLRYLQADSASLTDPR